MMASTDLPVQNDWVRRINRLNVYQLLSNGVTTTRAEIARDTGLSIPTVTTILGEFTNLELVEVVGEAQSRGGRPAQTLKFNADARCVLSLDLSGENARAALVNLKGQLYSLPNGPRSGRGVEASLNGWVRKLLEGQQKKRISRIAVSVPGVVDQATGHVRLAPALGWNDYALGDELGKVSGIKVILENDVNALALAEKTHSEPAAFRHVLFVRIDKGIGAGLFINGDLYRGAGLAAGEIGYSLLPHLSGGLTLGAPGPLETYLLDLTNSFSGADGQLQLDTDHARCAFAQFATTFGLILHNLICLLNPQRIVISWPADGDDNLVNHLRDSWAGLFEVEFSPSLIDDSAALRGSGQIALDDLASALCYSPSAERFL